MIDYAKDVLKQDENDLLIVIPLLKKYVFSRRKKRLIDILRSSVVSIHGLVPPLPSESTENFEQRGVRFEKGPQGSHRSSLADTRLTSTPPYSPEIPQCSAHSSARAHLTVVDPHRPVTIRAGEPSRSRRSWPASTTPGRTLQAAGEGFSLPGHLIVCIFRFDLRKS